MPVNTTITPRLYIFSGLPGAGKTTLAKALSQDLKAAYLRLDTIEQTIREVCQHTIVADEGYQVAWRLATDNLANGLSVVGDSCNPIEITRLQWQAVAQQAGVPYVNIEVVCSDATMHQHRLETRPQDIPNLPMPTWADVQARDYAPWTHDRLLIDTAQMSEAESLLALKRALAEHGAA